MKRHRQYPLLATMALLAIGTVVPSMAVGQEARTLSQPTEIVDYLVEVGGVTRMISDEGQALLDEVGRDPARFVASVGERLRLPDATSERPGADVVDEFKAGATLLRLLGPVHASDVGQSAYRSTSDRYQDALDRYDEAAQTSDSASARESLLILSDYAVMRRHVIKELGYAGSSALIDTCLTTIADEDYTIQLSMLQYFESTAVGDNRVITQLRELYTNETSSLRGDRALEYTLGVLESTSD